MPTFISNCKKWIRVKLLRSDGESSSIFKLENNEYFLPISVFRVFIWGPTEQR